MQTITSSEQQESTTEQGDSMSDAELERQLTEARAASDTLTAASAEADRLANAAAETFRREPSTRAHGEMAVAQQRALNASAAATSAIEHTAELAAETERRERARRIRELEPQASASALIDGAHGRIAAIVRAVREQLTIEGQRLLGALAARDAASVELAELTGQPHERLRMQDVRDQVARRLQTDFATRRTIDDPRGIALILGQDHTGRHIASLEVSVHFEAANAQ